MDNNMNSFAEDIDSPTNPNHITDKTIKETGVYLSNYTNLIYGFFMTIYLILIVIGFLKHSQYLTFVSVIVGFFIILGISFIFYKLQKKKSERFFEKHLDNIVMEKAEFIEAYSKIRPSKSRTVRYNYFVKAKLNNGKIIKFKITENEKSMYDKHPTYTVIAIRFCRYPYGYAYRIYHPYYFQNNCRQIHIIQH